jgi:hypothetical protein
MAGIPHDQVHPDTLAAIAADLEPQFLVSWYMSFDADGPVDAAKQAFGVQRDPESIATVFFVIDPTGNRFRIDLNNEGGVNYAVNDNTEEPIEDHG